MTLKDSFKTILLTGLLTAGLAGCATDMRESRAGYRHAQTCHEYNAREEWRHAARGDCRARRWRGERGRWASRAE
jgi:hypothetical protein